jgi:hypothetical protein
MAVFITEEMADMGNIFREKILPLTYVMVGAQDTA